MRFYCRHLQQCLDWNGEHGELHRNGLGCGCFCSLGCFSFFSLSLSLSLSLSAVASRGSSSARQRFSFVASFLLPSVPGQRHLLAEETWHEAPVASGSDPVGSTASGLEREDRCSRDLHDSRQPLTSKCSRRATLSMIQGRGYLQTEASPHGSDPSTIVHE